MADTYLTRQTTVPTSEKTHTFSTWLKKSRVSGDDQGVVQWFRDTDTRWQLLFDSSASALRFYSKESGTLKVDYKTKNLYRDPSAWMHICYQCDTTNAVSGDRLKMWINGEQITDWETETNDYAHNVNINCFDGTSGDDVEIGIRNTTPAFQGIMAETYYIDGSLIAYSQFGETDSTSGIWVPKLDPTISSYGNAGFYLKYANSSDLGEDSSGNDLDMTVTGTGKRTKDTPSNNFATLNPLTKDAGGAKTYSYGNTKVAETANSWTGAHSSLAVSAGKWYFETKVTYTSSDEAYVGCSSVPEINAKTNSTFYIGQGGSIGYYTSNGDITKDSATTSSYGSAVTSGQIMGVALDITNELAYFSINGVWQNSADPVAGSGGVAFPSGMTGGEFICFSMSPNQSYLECNFGNGYFGVTAVTSSNADDAGIGEFEYDVPTGYYTLCTNNIATYG